MTADLVAEEPVATVEAVEAPAGGPADAPVDAPGVDPARAADLALLRRFEPVIRYTKGEFFYPMCTAPYVEACDLWAMDARGRRRKIARVGEVTLDTLVQWRHRVPDRSLYLRFVQHPYNGVEMASRDRPVRDHFSAPSRLARVGVIARLIDAGFDLSLLVRGSVPGGTVGAADAKYAAIRERDPRFVYHARVVRMGGWTVLHYMFFYAMNDWRSSFAGANDHEADWEQCFVFVEEHADGTVTPVWFARAAHEEVGADMRRRWDDPIVERVGDHPVIYAGAGSHAAYIEQGEYVLPIPVQMPNALRRAAKSISKFWFDTLGQGQQADRKRPVGAIPFVDYARGDGVGVGPGEENAWTQVWIDDAVPWVGMYDGLFGLDTQDRVSVLERAPAGPKFSRDGRPRQSWVDPIAFAGLETTPPPGRAVATLEREIEILSAAAADDEAALAERDARAQRLGIRVAAAARAGRSTAFVASLVEERDRAVAEVRSLRISLDASRTAVTDCRAELARLRAGDPGDPVAHLRHVVHPQDPSEIRLSRAMDVWSAVSVALALAFFGALLYFDAKDWWIGLLAILGSYIVIEAVVRRRVLELLLQVTIALAVVGLLILLRTSWLVLISAVLAVVGLLILRDNLRELRWTKGRPH